MQCETMVKVVLRILVITKILEKAQRESARRRKSDWKKIQETEISLLAKSH